MNQELNRRQAITTMTATAAGIAALSSIANANTKVLETLDLGYDHATSMYTLPPLPYGYADLEPHIDQQTMTIHHDKHHAGYVNGLNNAIKQLGDIRDGTSDASVIQHWQRQLAFHAGGHINHTLFWTGMAPETKGGGGVPTGALANAIDRNFGSFEKFKAHFKAASNSVEASGWGWLVYEPLAKKLLVTQMQNQQQMIFPTAIPLLGVDVWEHAYYLNYQNRRADYIDAFMNIINWSEIQRRFDAATA